MTRLSFNQTEIELLQAELKVFELKLRMAVLDGCKSRALRLRSLIKAKRSLLELALDFEQRLAA